MIERDSCGKCIECGRFVCLVVHNPAINIEKQGDILDSLSQKDLIYVMDPDFSDEKTNRHINSI